ncbi:MAG: 4'-phosphopantetheinyl transferase family protein [Prevotella sp.]
MNIYIDDTYQEIDLDMVLLQLSEQRREQVLRFKHEGSRKQCAAAYLLLKRALKEVYGIDENPVFEYEEGGKPTLVGHPEIHFNLSHCAKAVVCVVADSPVGIDVEETCRYKDSLAHYAMNEKEYEEINNSDNPAETFIRLWTMKEALLKYTGEGLRREIKSVLNLPPASDVDFYTEIHEGYIVTGVKELNS